MLRLISMKRGIAVVGDTNTVLVISPHAKIKISENPTEGVECRISMIAKFFIDKSKKIITLEPSDLQKDENTHCVIREYFYAFDFIKIKNMRLGSYFLSLNPFFYYILFKLLKQYSPSVIIISFPWGVFSTWTVAKKIFKLNTVIVHDSHNVESEYAKIIMKDKNIPKMIKFFYHITIGLIERLALKYADYTLAISYENKRMFVDKYRVNPEKIRVVPPNTCVENSSVAKQSLKKPRSQIYVVFHGIYRTIQNKEAIDMIIQKSAPKFIKYKNLKFIIFGKGVPKTSYENVISLGFVDNVHDILRKCDIAIVPLISGEGVKLKMLDYMVAGLPIVTTKKGAEGLDLVNGKHAIIIDGVDEEFIKAIEYLAENPKIRRRLGHNARKIAEKRHEREKIGTRIKELAKNLEKFGGQVR